MAIELEDKSNVNPPDSDFPFGDVRDKTPSVSGTRWDRETMSDYIQFFHKMMSEAGVTYNGSLDNEANGWQFYEAFRKLTKPYKVYAALITQTSTSAPVAIVLTNELGGTPVWSRVGVGEYAMTLSAPFVEAKTAVLIQDRLKGFGALGDYITARRTSNSVISVYSGRASNSSYGVVNSTDGIISNATFIEVRVYD